MRNIVIFGAPHSGKTTLLGYLSTAMLRHPQFNDEVLQRLKLIRGLGMEDDFHIGDPYDPVHVRKDIILPAFVSLDRDELRKFTDQKEKTEGGSKRLHHKQLTLCMSGRKESWDEQNENENISCTFIDLPGFRQRISDKYRGFFEGDIGLAVLDIAEVLKLASALRDRPEDNLQFIEKQEKKLFEPVRIWCDYRSSAQLIIVLSKIDQELDYRSGGKAVAGQNNAVEKAVRCIRDYTEMYGRGDAIPIVPISIQIIKEKNIKIKPRMKVFFKRVEENIYVKPLEERPLPGDGPLIACLRSLLEPYAEGRDRAFSMASVDRPMRAMVNHQKKTALQIRAVHGNLHNTETVFLGPVLDRRTKDICYVRCGISSLKADGAEKPCSTLFEGNVGGVIFKGITDNIERRVSKQYILNSEQAESDIRILRSTVMFKGEVVQGDVVSVEICTKEYMTVSGKPDMLYVNVLRTVEPYDEMVLFWYGKKIIVRVIEIYFCEEKLCLSVILPKSQQNSAPSFALPCNKKREVLHCDSVLLAVPESNYLAKASAREMIYTYVSARIAGIKNSAEYNGIWIEGSQGMGLEDILKGSFRFEAVEKTEGREKLLIPVKSSQKKYSINAALTGIGKNLKNNFNRTDYWRAGGVRIYMTKTVAEKSGNNDVL